MDCPFFNPALAFGIAAVIAAVGTAVVLSLLKRHAILDHPNDRSSHAAPVPRGGGIAIIATLLIGWACLFSTGATGAPSGGWIVLTCAVVLAGLSWADDIGGLPVALRLAAHLGAVIVVLTFAAPGLVFQGLLPPLADRIIAGILWVWFINLFNFMDGIDGISAVETMTLGLGTAAVVFTAATLGINAGPLNAATSILPLALICAGAATGFLLWNRPPAKIFLGDVGSIPLGFVLGWLLLELAALGFWAAALILPMFYLMDASLTLIRRALRGEKVWLAHRDHFYQMPVAHGVPHGAILFPIVAVNGSLVVLAALSPDNPIGTLATAFVVVAGVLWVFTRLGRSR